MARTVGTGIQDFGKIRENNCFYVDKTAFIKEWWEGNDEVTLIARPRRFGKTLNMSMLEKFFSIKYAGRGDLFEGLSVWQEEAYRKLQGTYPVIFLSFSDVKEGSYQGTRKKIGHIIRTLYDQYDFLPESGKLNRKEIEFFWSVSPDMEDYVATRSLNVLSGYLMKYYGKKAIILLDEYDTPMQEAYLNGYWTELVGFTRSLFNSTFKTNPYLERGVMTGITRVSKESIFSDLNNLKVVATTSDQYADCFGFTEEEVFAALEEFGMSDRRQDVKRWYDGFTFGGERGIYNPWSIASFLDNKGKAEAYWANTSSNRLAGKLVREGTSKVKQEFETLLNGGSLHAEIDEQIVFSQLSVKKNAVWSLLLASGYLKAEGAFFREETGLTACDLSLTNHEVRVMFGDIIRDWFTGNEDYGDFVTALLAGDLKAMNTYMNRVAAEMFSSFDSGTKPSDRAPERFYHGFVLGLMADLGERYAITSNQESGFGRYDVMLEPKTDSGEPGGACGRDAIIIEFKVQEEEERELSDTVQAALRQIEEKGYQANLTAKGIPSERIRKYGFAFCGKRVLIGGA